MKKETNKQKFIKKAKKIHNNKYNYSLVNYENSQKKISIICPTHGIFNQIPASHVHGNGCPKCGRKRTIAASKKITTKILIQKAKKIHNDKYDYSLTNYINPKIKIEVTCKLHGNFKQLPYTHLKGSGCPKCGAKKPGNKSRSNKDEFIQKAKKIHNDKYDYFLVNYTNARKHVDIICKKHGIFNQTPTSHLSGKGCQKCAIEKITDNKASFLQKAIKTHGEKYDYSKSIYKNSKIKILITCPIHGDFYQTPSSHIRGYGCPQCHESNGEKTIRKFLQENNIKFIPQKKFKNCKNIKTLPYDFFLPKYNLCIEYDGMQHFKPIKYFGGIKTFRLIQKRDKIKSDFCKTNNIILLRITHRDNVIKILKLFFEESLQC